MTNRGEPLDDARHHGASTWVRASPAQVFAVLDDHQRLAAHMSKPSPMMAGASMTLHTDERLGRGVGARLRLSGRVLGLALELEEEVDEYEPPRRKVLRTIGQPRLLVVGPYRLGFELQPEGDGTRLQAFIDYGLPARGVPRLLGRLFGAFYARWCIERMLADATAPFRGDA